MDNNPLRVYRGGSWAFRPSVAQVASRNQYAPGGRNFALGVRLVRWLNPMERLAQCKEGK